MTTQQNILLQLLSPAPARGSYEALSDVGDEDYNIPLLEGGEHCQDSPSHSTRPQPWPWRHRWLILFLITLLLFLVVLVLLIIAVVAEHRLQEAARHPSSGTSPNSPSVDSGIGAPPASPLPHTDDPVEAARRIVDALYARQSTTLEQATSRYTLKTGRSPPQNYDQWFQFAQDKSCLIDDYDRLHKDFKPFYQLAQTDPGFFQRRLDVAFHMMEYNMKGMANITIKNGKLIMPVQQSGAYYPTWAVTFDQFAAHLPDMTFLINSHDQARVVFNFRDPDARLKALNLVEEEPFSQSPHPTSNWFREQSGCNTPRVPDGFFTSTNDDSAFFISTPKTEFTTDLYPVLSMSKVSPCFADILFPIEYFYERAWWSGKFAWPNNIEWKDKSSKLYWRGTSTGGFIFGTNYREFPRFKLAEFAYRHSDLIDARITGFSDELCGSECDKAAIIEEYNITGSGDPREDEYKFKYLLDVDGNAFSGRFHGLLRSGSLVFKATLFEEYFNDWVRPYEHYIPVLPDWSDLLEKLEWAKTHDDEARLIQERGMEVGRRVLTDNQNDCYFFLVLLEWARLQEISRNATDPHR
ncbi:CAP10 domain-containing protein [Favolaschia claudopus]|uniref:CAP10 domain-containing protein n=1 Tax=Favolaschia claudopus TaxID=2862362 RepID=A0AAW0CEA4_9AGAR